MKELFKQKEDKIKVGTITLFFSFHFSSKRLSEFKFD
jgi:hypothetical protein